MKKKIWIVGASSGIGLELVKLWLKKGYNVVASARTASKSDALKYLKNSYETQLIIINIDATNQSSIHEATKEAWNAFNGIDWWFYNAGDYDVMKLNNLDIKKFEQMNNVNYLGAVRVFNEILPFLQEQKSGRIIWNASLSSYFGLPYGGGYSAPKAALVNLAQALHPELIQENIQLQIINHGFVKTRLTKKNDFEMPELMDPYEAAKEISQGLEAPYKFEIRFPLKLSLFLRVLRFLPEKWSLKLTRKMLR